ncbi:MAG TPA: hypothetical protein VNA27_05260 [Rubrobacteraceae bacterium]|nr:hypothetical protein [Rubrobacteraceae bacterium]
MGEAVSKDLRGDYEESRRKLGITEEKVWVQRTPIGQSIIVYWETEDPQRTLREMAASQDEFDRKFRELIESSAPTMNLAGEKPILNELLFEWSAR